MINSIKSAIVTSLAVSNPIMDSVLGQGLIRMTKDLGTWIAILSTGLTVIITIVLLMKKGAAEGNESGSSKNYNKSIGVVLICGILALIVGVIMAVIGSYFGVNVQV